MSRFEPIAIVGASCILPGALSPAELWSRVCRGDDLLREATFEDWGIDPQSAIANSGPALRIASARGGYVQGFRNEDEVVAALDPLFQWILAGTQQALGSSVDANTRSRTGLIAGNLGYPTRGLSRLAESVWFGEPLSNYRDRFQFGLPCALVADRLGLQSDAFCIDAACASSLYAIKLACDRLHDRHSDLMIAGGANHSDDLFLHAGFTALGALSPSQRSLPFHRDADGLIPAEGAAFVALKRLEDAINAGDRILAVIRGIAISNDGRAAGLLIPSQAGQVRAMRAALEMSALQETAISLFECHATGTPVGDGTEIRSMFEVYGRRPRVIGSLKSNLGHLITAAGAAGLIKILGAFQSGILPPTRITGELSRELLDSPFEVLAAPRNWESDEPRCAAVSAFGFGGNNAHLLVQEWRGLAELRRWHAPGAVLPEPLVIAGMGVTAGTAQNTDEFAKALLTGLPIERSVREIHVSLETLRFPPRDLEETLPQQLLVLNAASEAMAQAGDLTGLRVGVFTGIEADPEVARFGIRVRLEELLHERGLQPSVAWIERTRSDIVSPLAGPASVLACMPNMPANRLNNQFAFAGPGFTIGAGRDSGKVALQLAMRALRAGEIDAALVCAVDLSCHPVHEAAVQQLFGESASPVEAVGQNKLPADAAVAFLLRRQAGNLDALAVIEEPATANALDFTGRSAEWLGSAYAAESLLDLAMAVVCLRHAAHIGQDATQIPWLPTGGRWTARAAGIGLSPSGLPRGWLSSPIVLQTANDTAATPAGSVAFVYTCAAAAYAGAARDLLVALPELAARLSRRFPDLDPIAGWLYQKRTTELSPLEQLLGSSFVCQLHTELTRGTLGIEPAAVIGLSSGETNSLFGSGTWDQYGINNMLDEIASSGMYDKQIAGNFGIARQAWGLDASALVNWANFRVLASPERLRVAMAREERVHLLIIHAPEDCLIGGDRDSCMRVLQRCGSPIAYDVPAVAVHCPEMKVWASGWRALHLRQTTLRGRIRVYSNALGEAYVPDADRIADLLLEQASTTVDFPRTILRAWEDGLRIFVEHGPRSLCSEWIGKILGDRPHITIPLDTFGTSSLDQVLHAIHRMKQAGIELRTGDLFERLEQAACVWPARSSARSLTVQAHPRSFAIPPLEQEQEPTPDAYMAPAPDVLPAMTHAPRLDGRALPPQSRDHEIPAAISILREIGNVHREAQSGHIEILRRTLQTRGRLLGNPNAKSHAVVAATALAHVPEALPPAPVTANRYTVPPAGRSFTRAELEVHASGQISSIFGPQFAFQDRYRRQVRMPMDPLLFPDRITGITGDPGPRGTGAVWSETDIHDDSWFLHGGRITPGILVEAGQSDLFLISWLGVDSLNRDQRKYRILSCQVTFRASLPKAGATLCYDIHINGHANIGDVRLFFFQFDCRVDGEIVLSMRNGQAGFFTDEELASSAGVIWDPDKREAPRNSPFASPSIVPRHSYSESQVRAFAEGRAFECFGAGYEWLATHSDTPRIPCGRLQLIHQITDLDPAGGPWKRGYLRAIYKLRPDDWFLPPHFLNDPCMPGTLMVEAAGQALQFYLAAIGFTARRDGWRSEPIPREPLELRCRGQVIPGIKEIGYEVFVRRVENEPEPVLYADLLGTIDGGMRAVLAENLALRLVPDWPLEKRTGEAASTPLPSATFDGIRLDHDTMLACALGRPSRAFGKLVQNFDGSMRMPRLPGPPYLFLTRIIRLQAEAGRLQVGSEIDCVYDFAPGLWFQEEDSTSPMPFAVLSEAGLQPCGWLAVYVGCGLTSPCEMFFRNLDGKATVYGEVRPRNRRLTTRVRLTGLSEAGGVTLTEFDVESHVDGRPILKMRTGFGHFSGPALAAQVGLPGPGEETSNPAGLFPMDLNSRPVRIFGGSARLPDGDLLMIDRITAWWPEGGRAKLGRVRAEKDVNPSEWFFKAHFFQDPVMPGSLGVAALIQLLQFLMLQREDHRSFRRPRFEPVASSREILWKYRGQVTPDRKCVGLEVEITSIEPGERDLVVTAAGWLFVDAMPIYSLTHFSMRIRESEEPA
jgi:acyl transferase domain-containing protein/3-hydroxymyristoyl/3-hydroxydecanoyl-(acyl carrier protein) dehydratase